MDIFLFLNLGLISLIWLPDAITGWKLASLFIILGVICKKKFKIRSYLIFFAIGITWSLVYVQFRPHLTPENYYVPLELEGVVIEEPKLYKDSIITSFIFKIEYLHGKQLKKSVKVKLFNSKKLGRPIELKNRYRLRTKLKIPHGYRNDGGMDSERYYFFKGILGIGEAKEMIFLFKDKLSWREQLIIKVKNYLKKYPLSFPDRNFGGRFNGYF